MAQLLAHFPADVVGTLQEVQPISIGLIHKTYRLTTSTGIFSFQQLHPKLATDGILADYEAVLAHLNQADFPAPTLCKTNDNHVAYTANDESRWRLTTWIDGHSHNQIKSNDMVRSAATRLGQFHQVMNTISYTFQSTHPLHDTPHHMRCLQEAVATHQNSEWYTRIQPLVDDTLASLPTLLLPDHLPQRVVHGDPKISNILFDDQEQAVGIIDLDTCTRHSILVDLGDAIRSWCQEGSEDQQASFSPTRFQAIIEGYAQSNAPITPEEIARLPQAGRHITLELTARFLTDVLEDSYFAWDQDRYASRREHNLARAENMHQLASQMHQVEATLQTIVNDTFAR